jgi:hypothetical protein
MTDIKLNPSDPFEQALASLVVKHRQINDALMALARGRAVPSDLTSLEVLTKANENLREFKESLAVKPLRMPVLKPPRKNAAKRKPDGIVKKTQLHLEHSRGLVITDLPGSVYPKDKQPTKYMVKYGDLRFRVYQAGKDSFFIEPKGGRLFFPKETWAQVLDRELSLSALKRGQTEHVDFDQHGRPRELPPGSLDDSFNSITQGWSPSDVS